MLARRVHGRGQAAHVDDGVLGHVEDAALIVAADGEDVHAGAGDRERAAVRDCQLAGRQSDRAGRGDRAAGDGEVNCVLGGRRVGLSASVAPAACGRVVRVRDGEIRPRPCGSVREQRRAQQRNAGDRQGDDDRQARARCSRGFGQSAFVVAFSSLLGVQSQSVMV